MPDRLLLSKRSFSWICNQILPVGRTNDHITTMLCSDNFCLNKQTENKKQWGQNSTLLTYVGSSVTLRPTGIKHHSVTEHRAAAASWRSSIWHHISYEKQESFNNPKNPILFVWPSRFYNKSWSSQEEKDGACLSVFLWVISFSYTGGSLGHHDFVCSFQIWSTNLFIYLFILTFNINSFSMIFYGPIPNTFMPKKEIFLWF